MPGAAVFQRAPRASPAYVPDNDNGEMTRDAHVIEKAIIEKSMPEA